MTIRLSELQSKVMLMNNEQQYSPLDKPSSQLVNDEMWLQRIPEEYRQTVEQNARLNGLPISTAVKMLNIENAQFDPNAISPTGAMGLSQVLPSTGADMGYTPEQLRNPHMNIAAGLKYLGQQNKRFNGDEDLTLGAYNMGPHHMNQILAGEADWTPEGHAYVKKSHMLDMTGAKPTGDPQIASSNGVRDTSDTFSNLNSMSNNTWGQMARSPFPQIEVSPVPDMVDNNELPAPAGLVAMAKQFNEVNKAKRKNLVS